jgi:hypothetical protein
MFGDGSLTFQEYAMGESLPLSAIHDGVLEFLRDRDDAVLYGAQAVNAYVDEPRMTNDVDIASTRAKEFAEDLRRFLNQRFHIAARVRTVRDGLGFRIYQVRKPQNRHLIDVRPVDVLPPAKRIKKVLVVSPAELIASKTMSMIGRQHKAKGLIDRADLYRLLLTFPELKKKQGLVEDRLRAAEVGEDVMAAWNALVAERIESEDDDDKFGSVPGAKRR